MLISTHTVPAVGELADQQASVCAIPVWAVVLAPHEVEEAGHGVDGQEPPGHLSNWGHQPERDSMYLHVCVRYIYWYTHLT